MIESISGVQEGDSFSDVLYIYYIYIIDIVPCAIQQVFLLFFSVTVSHRILKRVPWAAEWLLVV